MATNTINIIFEECEPAPLNGYLIKYRPKGSDEPFREASPNALHSPAVVVDNNDPLGTGYEGTIQGDCGGGVFGPEVPWDVGNSVSGSGSTSESTIEPPAGKNVFLVNETDGFVQVITDVGTYSFAAGFNGNIVIVGGGTVTNNSGSTWKFTFIQSMPSTLAPLEAPNPETLLNLASHVLNADVSTINYLRVAAP